MLKVTYKPKIHQRELIHPFLLDHGKNDEEVTLDFYSKGDGIYQSGPIQAYDSSTTRITIKIKVSLEDRLSSELMDSNTLARLLENPQYQIFNVVDGTRRVNMRISPENASKVYFTVIEGSSKIRRKSVPLGRAWNYLKRALNSDIPKEEL